MDTSRSLKWDWFLLTTSLLLLAFEGGANLVEYMFQAELLAEELAPRLLVEKGRLQDVLAEVLSKYSLRQSIGAMLPIGIISLLLFSKLIVDLKARDK